MNCAGARGRKTNAQSPRVFRPSACHESSRFFVTDPDKANTVLAPPQSVEYRIYAIAHHSENMSDTPLDHVVQEDVGCCGILPGRLRRLPRNVGSMFAPDFAGTHTDCCHCL